MKNKPDNWQLVDRGMLCRCPHCGTGKLYKKYLKPVDECAECGEALGHIRADDGPAWLTILLVGHILVPMIFMFDFDSEWTIAGRSTFWSVMAVLLTLFVLPRAKAFFIGLTWRNECLGSEAIEAEETH
jgi:uncharacterized protein (DUF983 family)